MKRKTTRQKAATLARGARKAVSLLACFALAFSMLGIPAFAEEADTEEVPAAEEADTSADEGGSTEGLNPGWTLATDDDAEGEEPEEGEAVEEGIVPNSEEITPLEDEDSPVITDSSKNIVNIEIVDAKIFPGYKDTPFNVTLSGDAGTQSSTKVLKDVADESHRASFTMKNVSPGDYTLTITADRYKTYEQPLYIYDDGAHSYRVRIYTWAYEPAAEDFYPGVMFYGDVNDDNEIDALDVESMVDALSTGTEEELAAHNLTGHESTTLADLLVLSDAVGREAVQSSEQRSALANPNYTPPTGENLPNVDISENVTTINDDTSLSDLFEVIGNPESELALKLQSDEPIDESNPIVLEFNNISDIFGEHNAEGELVEVPTFEGLTIKPPVQITDDGDLSTELHPHAITEGSVLVTFEENGEDVTQEVTFRMGESSNMVETLARSLGLLPEKAYALAAMMATVRDDGTIEINFGQQIAVKKVTLRVTKTAASDGNLNLAEISTVEFLNNMETKVDVPDMDIPEGLQAQALSKSFQVSWNRAVNVTGYQVSVENGGIEQVYSTTGTSMTISAFKGGVKGKIQNGVTYNVKVQSVNGNWKSGWSEAIMVTPMATKAPDAPENVQAVGNYRMISVSWKAMEDTDFYNIYYRVKDDSNPNGVWEKIGNIQTNSYTITGLADETYYQIHVKGENEIGVSPPSATVLARTTSISPATLPQYLKIDPSNIESSKVISGTVYYPDGTKNSNGMALFDDDYQTYFQINDWDYGVTYHYDDWGIQTTFKEAQDLGYITFAAAVTDWQLGAMRVTYTDENGKAKVLNNVPYYTRSCENGRKYVVASLGEGIKAKAVRIGLQTKNNARYINVAEINFLGNDRILADINALYTDDMHIALKDNVTEDMLTELQQRLDTAVTTPNGQEYTPLRSILQVDLDYAKQLYKDANGAKDTITQVHTDMYVNVDNNKNLKFSGLNAWQPLGKSVAAEQEVIVYVGSPSSSNGSTSKIQLLVGQQNGESSQSPSGVTTLKTGRNIVSIPKKATHDASEKGEENGGQLYVQYTGTNAKEKWSVRVLGAAEIPTLDLYGVTDAAEKQARAEKYVEALAARSSELSSVSGDKDAHIALHHECPTQKGNINIAGPYSRTGCTLNATEIMTDHILFSVAATRVNSALGNKTTAERAAKLVEAIEGTDQVMDLFYQHKGLMKPTSTSGTIAATNQAPVRHLNIRMMTMFAGAFMYAAGNHIGVGYNECAEFTICKPFTAEANGKYFGWGTAHEIGHNINDGAYSFAEVTNNYFAQLCKTANGGSTRFDYATVYDRVASGEMGRTRSVFIQLAMYWQLMLANDMLDNPSNKVYTQYSTYTDLFNNRFFARVDSYSRNPGSAPKPGNVALSLNGGESQNIIRLACAASQSDLREFFKAWGFASNDDTDAYASQFPKEQLAVQYASDATVAWANSHQGAADVAGKNVVNATAAEKDSKVTVDITCTDSDVVSAGSLIGYEVRRCRYESGKPISEAVGFTRANDDGSASLVDDAAHLGSRAVWYEVKAIDQFLNWSNPAYSAQCKLTGDGIYSTKGWTATTNMSTSVVAPSATVHEDVPLVQADEAFADDGVSNEPNEDESSCVEKKDIVDYSAIQAMLNGNLGRDFVGKATEAPYVLIDMHTTNPVSALRYTPGENGAAITDYKIEASTDGIKFSTVKKGTFDFKNESSNQVFFNGVAVDDEGNVILDEQGDPVSSEWVVVEQARYLKITATSQANKEISIDGISVYGPTGDAVDFAKVEGQEDVPAVGILDEDYQLDANDPNQKIPQGSLVFTGAFKGNPAYNVVVLYDEDGTIIGATDQVDGAYISSCQAIFAKVPENTMIGNTEDGRWVYWIDGSAAPDMVGKKVRAELYRVNNAFTNEGQRLVADSMLFTIPSDIPPLHLSGGAINPDEGSGEDGGDGGDHQGPEEGTDPEEGAEPETPGNGDGEDTE